MRKFFLNFMTVVLATSLVMVSCDEKLDVDDPYKDQNQTENPDNGGNTTPTTPTVDYVAQGYKVFETSDIIDAVYQQGIAEIMWGNETDSLLLLLGIGANETLPKGEYTMEDTEDFSELTWQYGYCFYIDVENEIGDYLTDGTIEISKKGRQYTVLTKCINSDGDSVKYAYVGDIQLEELGLPDDPYYGEVEGEDQTFTLSRINAAFYGDYYGTGNNNYYCSFLSADEFVNVMLDMTANSTSSATEMPTGTFTVVAVEDAGAEFSITAGYFNAEAAEENNNMIYGLVNSCVAINDGSYYTGFYYITGGSLEVSKTESTYTIAGELTTALGTTLTISYEGAISLTDKSQTNSVTVKTFNANNDKKLKFNRRALQVRK